MNIRSLPLIAVFTISRSLSAQVDQPRAAVYFGEVAELCAREGTTHWGMSLCGPIALVDAATHTIATNEPAPAAPRPAAFGFANFAADWAGVRWSSLAWPLIPADRQMRDIVFIHELFHRIQPQLGLLLPDPPSNRHLDTPEGRLWLRLEWRALAKAVGSTGQQRIAATRDALAFRSYRRSLFPGAEESERVMEINEGLAQYTGTVVVCPIPADAVTEVIAQLNRAAVLETFIRTFPYPLGAAYGLLLDEWSPGWSRRVKATDDLGKLVMAAAKITPAPDVNAAAGAYDIDGIRAAEARREADRIERVATYRTRFVTGPVLLVPNGGNNSFTTNGMTPVDSSGTIYPHMRAVGVWGILEADFALLSLDNKTLTVPAPSQPAGDPIRGDGWTLALKAGWVVRPGTRTGDWRVVRDSIPP